MTFEPCRSEIEKLKRYIQQEMPDKEEQERIETEYLESMERFKKCQKTIKDEHLALTVGTQCVCVWGGTCIYYSIL